MSFPNVKIRENRKKHNSAARKAVFLKMLLGFSLIVFSTVLSACRQSKVDLRRLAPDNAIIYLETNDLGKALQSLVENQAFRELAAAAPDFSALENIQLAVAVTSFETSENQITDENSVLNFTPRFVAVAETHAWQWQTVALVENQLNEFVLKNYGAETRAEKSDKWGGRFFKWSARDGRQVFAFVKSSRIYFGNDAAAIETSLHKPNGENSADGKTFNRAEFADSENNLAFGYISNEGIRRIADFAGVSIAVETSEEDGAKSFIAGALPQILRNATEEIVWTANKTGRGIEDNYRIRLKPETATVAKETLTTTATTFDAADFLPAEFSSATRYNLKNPLIGWRGLLALTAKNTDALTGNLLMQFSGALLEPYGIGDAETFLDSIDSEITTVQFDASGEKSAAIVTAKNVENLKNSISKEINFQTPPTEQFDAEIWFSADRRFVAAFVADKFIIGDGDGVLKCLAVKQSGENFTKSRHFQKLAESRAVAVTFGSDTDSVDKIVGFLTAKKNENRRLATFYTTETRFTEKGIERRTVSDFGLIGTILKQLAE